MWQRRSTLEGSEMSNNIGTNWETISSRLSQLLCGLSGHELLLNAEPGRLSLKCMTCPYETPGWTIKEKEPQASARHQAPGVLIEQSAQF
jgi:hypothetical protein